MTDGNNISPNEKRDLILAECELEYYSPSQSMEYYNSETDTWYNHFGQELRKPKEYDPHQEGYTPFGDE